VCEGIEILGQSTKRDTRDAIPALSCGFPHGQPELIALKRSANTNHKHGAKLSSGYHRAENYSMADDIARLILTGPSEPDGSVKEGTKPYLIELGRLVLAWNDLHEKLAELYYTITQDPKSLQKWHDLRNDKEQRKLLRNAVASDLPKRINIKAKDGTERLKRIDENITWLLDEANTLADHRNNFLHAPFMFLVAEDGTLTMQSFSIVGNQRAQSLSGKNLLEEMSRHRENMAALAHLMHADA
jgi:hypothetical protein